MDKEYLYRRISVILTRTAASQSDRRLVLLHRSFISVQKVQTHSATAASSAYLNLTGLLLSRFVLTALSLSVSCHHLFLYTYNLSALDRLGVAPFNKVELEVLGCELKLQHDVILQRLRRINC